MAFELKERTLESKLRYWADKVTSENDDAPYSGAVVQVMRAAAAQLAALTAERADPERWALVFLNHPEESFRAACIDAIGEGWHEEQLERLRAERDDLKRRLAEVAKLPERLEFAAAAYAFDSDGNAVEVAGYEAGEAAGMLFAARRLRAALATEASPEPAGEGCPFAPAFPGCNGECRNRNPPSHLGGVADGGRS